MTIDLLDTVFTAHGTLAKGTENETIYQIASGKQVSYPGPKTPTQPRTYHQQINRVIFAAGFLLKDELTSNQIEIIKNMAKAARFKLHWKLFFVQQFLKTHRSSSAFFGFRTYGGPIPSFTPLYYGEMTFGDGFYCSQASVPKQTARFTAKYPNIKFPYWS